MFGIGLIGWCLFGLLLIVITLVAFYSRPATGKHALKSAGEKSVSCQRADESASSDSQRTIPLGPLFGRSDVISGYRVEQEDFPTEVFYNVVPIGVRPYLLHYWASLSGDPDQTVDFAVFFVADDELDDDEDDERQALAMVA